MKPGFWLILSAIAALSACVRSVPDDTGSGVGFGDYATYQQERRLAEARAQQSRTPSSVLPPERETVVPPRATASAGGNADLASLASAAIAEAEAPQPAAASSTASSAAPSNNTAISDEQDFDAVAARETIETDAERLARMAEQRVEIEPTAVPDRPGSTGPNIVEYALSTSHPVGQQVYRRSSIGYGRHEENCLSFQSPDLAQQAFLASGGPERDRQSLDPDGDGYACNWDPNIYRNAARGG